MECLFCSNADLKLPLITPVLRSIKRNFFTVYQLSVRFFCHRDIRSLALVSTVLLLFSISESYIGYIDRTGIITLISCKFQCKLCQCICLYTCSKGKCHSRLTIPILRFPKAFRRKFCNTVCLSPGPIASESCHTLDFNNTAVCGILRHQNIHGHLCPAVQCLFGGQVNVKFSTIIPILSFVKFNIFSINLPYFGSIC